MFQANALYSYTYQGEEHDMNGFLPQYSLGRPCPTLEEAFAEVERELPAEYAKWRIGEDDRSGRTLEKIYVQAYIEGLDEFFPPAWQLLYWLANIGIGPEERQSFIGAGFGAD